MKPVKITKNEIIILINLLLKSTIGYQSEMMEICVEALNYFKKELRNGKDDDFNMMMINIWIQTTHVEIAKLKYQIA